MVSRAAIIASARLTPASAAMSSAVEAGSRVVRGERAGFSWRHDPDVGVVAIHHPGDLVADVVQQPVEDQHEAEHQ
jgi:hypothetical protein